MSEFDELLADILISEINSNRRDVSVKQVKECILDGITEYLNINFYNKSKIDKDRFIKDAINSTISKNISNIYCEFFALLINSIYKNNLDYLIDMLFKRSRLEIDCKCGHHNNLEIKYENNEGLNFLTDSYDNIEMNLKCIYVDVSVSNHYNIFKSSLKTLYLTNDYSDLINLFRSLREVIMINACNYINKYIKMRSESFKYDLFLNHF